MTKSVVILLKGSLGEIIFCQGIAQHYIKGGYKVYWPVEFKYLTALKNAYPDINWLNEDWYSSDPAVRYDLLHALVAPLELSKTFAGGGDSYQTKYSMYGLDWKDWRKSAIWVRDAIKERSLFEELVTAEPYIVSSIPMDASIQMIQVVGYNIFDWLLIFQRADEIHIDKYGAVFMLDLLELKAKEIHIYDKCPNVNLTERHKYIIHV